MEEDIRDYCFLSIALWHKTACLPNILISCDDPFNCTMWIQLPFGMLLTGGRLFLMRDVRRSTAREMLERVDSECQYSQIIASEYI